ncbi:MAG: hypothetical protein P8Y80_17355, partial [Acidobacteriota bacterium]
MFRTMYQIHSNWNPSTILRPFMALIFLSFLFLPTAFAENWPQWRGPSGNSISNSPDLPVRWSTDENIKWKSPLAGLGVSSPIIWEDTIVVTSQKGKVPLHGSAYPQLARDDQTLAQKENPIGGQSAGTTPGTGKVYLTVEAFRKSDGKRLWEFSVEATGEFPELHEKHNLA